MFRPIKTSGRVMTSSRSADVTDDINNNVNIIGSMAKTSSVSSNTLTVGTGSKSPGNSGSSTRESRIASSNSNISRLLRSSASSRTRHIDASAVAASRSRALPGSTSASEACTENNSNDPKEDDDDKTDDNDDDLSAGNKKDAFGGNANYNPFVTDISDFEDDDDDQKNNYNKNDNDEDDDIIMRLTDGDTLYGDCNFEEISSQDWPESDKRSWLSRSESKEEDNKYGSGCAGRHGPCGGSHGGGDDAPVTDEDDVDMSTLDFSSLLMSADQDVDVADDGTGNLSERIREVHLDR